MYINEFKYTASIKYIFSNIIYCTYSTVSYLKNCWFLFQRTLKVVVNVYDPTLFLVTHI